MRTKRREPNKFELAATAWQTAPCPNCGRDLRVPAHGREIRRSSCICGEEYNVWVEGLEICFSRRILDAGGNLKWK